MIDATLYVGRSAHPVMNGCECDVYSLQISRKKIKRPFFELFKKKYTAPLEEMFTNIFWFLYLQDTTQCILSELRPEGGALNFSEIDACEKWLHEAINSKKSSRKNIPPANNSTWPDNVFYKQYLMQIDSKSELLNVFKWFKNFDMMNVYLFKSSQHIDSHIAQLSLGYANQEFDLQSIVEDLNAFVYSDFHGDSFIVECTNSEMIDKLVTAHHLEVGNVSKHPLAKNDRPKKALWFGKKRIFPPER